MATESKKRSLNTYIAENPEAKDAETPKVCPSFIIILLLYISIFIVSRYLLSEQLMHQKYDT